MAVRRRREVATFGLSFLDVLSNTIGGLALLLLLALLMMGDLAAQPPVIVTERLHDGYEGEEYEAWLAAREGTGAFLWSRGVGEWPEGLALDARTGRLAGKAVLPPGSAAREYEFEVRCAGGGDESAAAATRRLRLRFLREAPAVSLPLQILTESPLPDAQRGHPYTLALAGEGGGGVHRWILEGPLPPGMRADEKGRLFGIPGDTGIFEFTAILTCGGAERVSRALSLAVGEKHPPPPPVPPLRPLTRELTAATAGRRYGVFPSAVGGVPPYSWSLAEGSPAWLSSADDGLFVGVPGIGDIGSRVVAWELRDAAGTSVRTAPMQLEVLPPPGRTPAPLRLRTRSLPAGRVGVAYELAVAADGGVPPYRWSHEGFAGGAAVPFVDEEGAFRGTPGEAGSSAGTVSVTDSEGERTSVALSLGVDPEVRPLAILTRGAVGRAGHRFDAALAASGGHPPYAWAIEGGSLPPGVELRATPGLLAGTPTSAGRFACSLVVRDAAGARSAPAEIALDILTSRGVRPLVIRTESLPTILRGSPTCASLACEGGEPPYEWTCDEPLPAGLRIERSAIVGEARETGRWIPTLRVRDASGESASVALPLTVRRVTSFWVAVALGLALAAALLLLVAAVVRVFRAPPLEITTRAVPNARASSEYVLQLACVGGAPPYRWRVAAGTLPPGLTLSEDGCISGAPFAGLVVGETREVRFTVEVRDRAGRSATREL